MLKCYSFVLGKNFALMNECFLDECFHGLPCLSVANGAHRIIHCV